jgi:uncharacterized protein (DUF1800 family)
VWLDNRSNQKARPNENFARELLELFTLGAGNYTEADVKEAARAFTGWHLRGDRFFFNAGAHDPREKTFLGETGPLSGEQVIDTILGQPACADFLVARVWRFFVSDSAPDGVLPLLAARLRASDYDVGDLVATVLRSRVFFAARSWRALIKSPVEFALGAVKALQIRAECRGLARSIAALGQTLFAPPTVKGWDGGRSWVSAQWMVGRANLAMTMTALRGGMAESRFTPRTLLERGAGAATPEALVSAFADVLLDGDLPDDERAALLRYVVRNDRSGGKDLPWNPKDEGLVDAKARGVAHLIMTLPEYQLA